MAEVDGAVHRCCVQARGVGFRLADPFLAVVPTIRR